MMGRLAGRRGHALAFVVGLIIASAATAGAASLITGKQIKDGSIGKRDLAKSIRAQLKKAGTPGATGSTGATGAKGEPGAAGTPGTPGAPGPFPDVLPSGKTLTGVYAITGRATGAGQYADSPIAFLFRFASAPAVVIVGITDTAEEATAAGCPGTAAAPKAAPATLCVYEMGHANTAPFVGIGDEAGGGDPHVAVYAPPTGNFGTTTPYGAILEINSAAAGSFYSNGVWAATSP